MRIEIKIGGLNGSLKKLESGFSDHIKDREKVISTFKDVRKRTYDVHGGYSDLHTAISYVDGRIAKEEHKIARAREAKKKTASLLELSRRVDAQVADQVDRNRHAFYDRFPHLKPESIKQEERKWYEKVWDWVCDTGKNIVNCVKKAWNGIKEYYTKHKKIFDTIFIALGAIIAIVGTVLTGGAALVALLGCLGIASSVAAVIATTVVVVSVVATAGSAILNIVDTWCEIDHPVFNTFQKVFDITAIVADVTLGGAELIDAIKKGVSKFFLKHGDDVLDTVGDVAARNLDDIGEAAVKNADKIDDVSRAADAAQDAASAGRTIPGTPGVVTGGNPQTLGKNILADMGVTDNLAKMKAEQSLIDDLLAGKTPLDKVGTEDLLKSIGIGQDKIDDILKGTSILNDTDIVKTLKTVRGKDIDVHKIMKWGKNSNYQAHHIIPVELRNHPIIKKIGMHLDDATNGIFLPKPNSGILTKSVHYTRHDEYTKAIMKYLDTLDASSDVATLEAKVAKLQKCLRTSLENGVPLRAKPKKLPKINMTSILEKCSYKFKGGGSTVDMWYDRILRGVN